MQTTIQARNFALTESLRFYAERRMDFALHSFQNSIQRVKIRLSDLNGPKGGVDKHCQLHIVLDDGLPEVIIKDTESNMYAAIDRALGRANRTVKRTISKRNSQLKHTNNEARLKFSQEASPE